MRSLDAIRATCEAATDGPWLADNPNSQESPLWQVSNDAYVNPTDVNDGRAFSAIVDCGSRADAEFIASARTDAPEMLAEIDRLTTALVEARSEIKHLQEVGAGAIGIGAILANELAMTGDGCCAVDGPCRNGCVAS